MTTSGVRSYEDMRKSFSWERFSRENFDWDPSQKFNMAHEVDRHAKDPKKTALFCVSAEGREEKYTYRELRQLTAKFANVLTGLGVRKGDRVGVMLSRCIECYVSFLGIWKVGAVGVPLFTAFGPEAAGYRIKDSGSKFLITDAENRGKLERIEGGLPGVQVIVVCRDKGLGIRKGDVSFYQEIADAPSEFDIVETTFDDPAVAQYTSGTTGPPKGTIIPHGGVISEVHYAKDVMDVREDDMFWGFMDPGWAHGLLAAGTTLLILGRSLLVYGGRLDPNTWYDMMDKYEVTVFTAAPTLYRSVMAAGDELAKKYRLRVRRFCSVGEYLNPECALWVEEHLGVPIADCYGLTEVGMVSVNYPFVKQKLGSMGKPIFGSEVAILDEAGNELPVGQTGAICVKRDRYFHGSGYLNEPDKWEARFIKGEWFDTGDLAFKDEEGYLFFRARADDIISTSGYRVGPGEVESALLAHPAVAEAAVVGKPDAQRMEAIKAFVVLRPTYRPSSDLARELQDFVRERYSKVAYPREIQFASALPKTESGKVKHRELREGV